MWNRKVFIRIIELVLCIACVVTLRVTDDESARVYHNLRNRSREWFLLNNITWGVIGAALATATCGGYTIISAGLLIAAVTGELKGRKTEKFLLSLGVLLFAIIGTLALFSTEDVPNQLVDNGIIFGALCIITAIVMSTDFLMSNPSSAKKKHDGTQTIHNKEQAGSKQYVTTTTMTINNEKEHQQPVSSAPPQPQSQSQHRGNNNNNNNNNVTSTWHSPPTPEMTEKRNSMNSELEDEEQLRREQYGRHERSERQMREYNAQNMENGRAGGRGKSSSRDQMDMPRKMNGYYRNEDVYQRPVDEVDDTPPFPTHEGTVFSKVTQPSIKIMRVDRDDDRGGYDNYRFSDTSQYDNVPTRLRGSSSSPGILKKQRDVSFVDPRRSREYREQQTSNEEHHLRRLAPTVSIIQDEIEMLEECFDALRTSTTSSSAPMRTTTTTTVASSPTGRKTTTVSVVPVTPSSPGYVKQTASNWPNSAKPVP